ncbi:hypothetical protein C8R44DRAFT_741630 [Mycena epipterygia]|nr:hypothetical protein C8R44DRAFT_741630 [Mycena epipterygia]
MLLFRVLVTIVSLVAVSAQDSNVRFDLGMWHIICHRTSVSQPSLGSPTLLSLHIVRRSWSHIGQASKIRRAEGSFPSPTVSYLQGSARSCTAAALTWVVYDISLTFEREVVSVWRSSWSLSKILFLFSRYNTIIALGFFLMEAIETKHFILPLNVPSRQPAGSSCMYWPSTRNLPMTNHPSTLASRWYLGLTEVLSILAGELLILIRINAVYGWSRKIVVLTLLFCSEAVIGLVTTGVSILGGSKGLLGSKGILACMPNQVSVPDVNISMWCTSMTVACIYIGLIIQKAIGVVQDIEEADGSRGKSLYFVVIFGVLLLNLVLILQHNRYAQLGTPWLLATYSVASTRIFLNLKDMSLRQHLHSGATWSECQQSSALQFHVQSVSQEASDWDGAQSGQCTRFNRHSGHRPARD